MGCGVIAAYGHLPAILETPGLQLASIYDPNPEQLARLQENFPDVAAFTDADAFFQSGIDAVSVTSPAPCHLDNVRMAARYGKHVLCEKPLAMNDTDIDEMIRIMDGADLLLATGFCYRFSEVALRIRDLVRSGVIGEVRALRMIYVWNLHGLHDYDAERKPYRSPRWIGRMVEGGPMVDCGVHQIDLARWWLDSEVVRHQATGAWVEGTFEAPDHMWLHMDHENGAHTAVEMSFSYGHTVKEPIDHFSYHLIGTDGIIRFDRAGWHFEVRNSEGTQFLPGNSEKNFTGMYHAWRDALETGQLGDLPTGRDGQEVTRIARTATEAVIAARLPLTLKG